MMIMEERGWVDYTNHGYGDMGRVAQIIIQFRTGMKGYIMHKIEMG